MLKFKNTKSCTCLLSSFHGSLAVSYNSYAVVFSVQRSLLDIDFARLIDKRGISNGTRLFVNCR